MAEEKKHFSLNLSRLFLMVLSAVLIVAFFPRQASTSYDYTIGKPWKYGQIITEYGFPIYKSDRAIRTELDSAFKTFQPYFRFNANVGNSELENFRKAYPKDNNAVVPAKYVDYVEQMLEKVYSAGIMDSRDNASILDSSYTAVRIEQGTNAVVRPIKNVFTVRSAYVYIMTMADSSQFDRNVLARCNLNEFLSENLTVDKVKNTEQRQDIQMSVSYASGMVQGGEKVIDRGDIVTPRIASIIESMKRESIKRQQDKTDDGFMFAGQFLLILLVLVTYNLYLFIYCRKYFVSFRSYALLNLMMVVFPVIVSIVGRHYPISVYMVPIVTVAIFVSVFMEARLAFITYFVTVVLATLSLHDGFVYMLVQMFAGVVAILSLKELTSRSQIIRTAFVVTALTLVFMFALDLSAGHTFKMLDPSWYTCEAINGVFLLFTYPFVFILERLFGFTSAVTLIELSNVNNPLMRELSKEAQGTFNHSMQVANLASEVAAKIDADVLLVRTGALYHDIGKIKNPAYFTENQSGTNPHDSLPCERSAQIIIQHVADGLELAEKYHLPRVIREFISTHHGTSKAGYFYVKYRNEHPDEVVDEKMFSYPGPNPFTKEQAILMMTDSVEAASKSLKNFDEETLRKLVDGIVDTKMKEGYFTNCPITFSDISIAKETFVQSLKIIYHTRISYPTLNEGKKPDGLSDRNRGNGFFGRRRNFYHRS